MCCVTGGDTPNHYVIDAAAAGEKKKKLGEPESRSMRTYLESQGVPTNAIYEETQARYGCSF